MYIVKRVKKATGYRHHWDKKWHHEVHQHNYNHIQEVASNKALEKIIKEFHTHNTGIYQMRGHGRQAVRMELYKIEDGTIWDYDENLRDFIIRERQDSAHTVG